MKKTYNQPACVVVVLGTTNHMLQASASLKIYKSSGEESQTIGSEDQILTNENKSVWDEEW